MELAIKRFHLRSAVGSAHFIINLPKLFHNLIAEASENTAIARTLSWLWLLRDQSELSRGFHRLIIEEGVYPVLDEHTAIFKALEARNPDEARKAMREHLEAATASAAQHFLN